HLLALGDPNAPCLATARAWVRRIRAIKTLKLLHPDRELHPHGGDWLAEVVFGLNDGLVTTLVFVLAISSVVPTQIVLIALGEVFAGAISMAMGGYLSVRTEHAILRQRIATERYEIAHEPEEERSELRRIYRAKGFREPLLNRLIQHITADHERWLDAMVRDELGIIEDELAHAPWQQGILVGGAFMIGGFVPVAPYLFSLPLPHLWAFAFTVMTAIVLGAVKARFTARGPLANALEFLGIIALGAVLGLAIGTLLNRLSG
ncbi:MAG: VIT1/CCC1 transporter family protein, partial [Chloroflexota bacterium]